MKKISLILLLITNINSMICMEHAKNITIEIYTNHNSTQQNWTVIQKPINDTSSENKTLLEQRNKIVRTITPKIHNTRLIKELYDNVYNFCENKGSEHELISLVCRINKAKAESPRLTEDKMAAIAYKENAHEKNAFVAPFYISTYQSILFFNCLKQYNNEVKANNEDYPHYQKSLADILDITTPENTNTKQFHVISSDTKNYPSFLRFAYSIKALLRNDNFISHKNLINCLYRDKSLPQEKKSSQLYNNLEDDFYDKAYSMLLNDGSTKDLYELLEMINSTITSRHIESERKLGKTILNFKPANTTLSNLRSLFNETYSVAYAQNKISLLCQIIQIYNQARKDKITPTPEHYHLYQTIKELNIALPDDFNENLFNADAYAFIEFENLIIKTRILMASENKDIQLLIDQIYADKDLL